MQILLLSVHASMHFAWQLGTQYVYLVYAFWMAQVVSHVGNIWIGPWANFPQYMDCTLGYGVVNPNTVT